MSEIIVTHLDDESSFGAEVTGVDLGSITTGWSAKANDASQSNRAGIQTEEIIQSIYRTFLEYSVLVFRNQHGLSPDQYIQVASMFGEVSLYPFAKGMDGYPAITEIIKEPHQTSNFGGMWHSDTTYLPQPPKCTLLYAIETPPMGLGDTLFADMYRAYENLNDEVKAKLDSHPRVIQSSSLNAAILRVNHLSSGSMKQNDGESKDPSTNSSKVISEAFQAAHPAVRTHPETKRKAVFVNPSHSAQFENETRDKSKALLEHLFQHCIQPEHTLRVSWEPGTLVVWDNRCLIHCAVNDYNGHRRVMRRITIAGDIPY